MFCKFCGQNLSDDSVFCNKCGAKIEPVQEVEIAEGVDEFNEIETENIEVAEPLNDENIEGYEIITDLTFADKLRSFINEYKALSIGVLVGVVLLVLILIISAMSGSLTPSGNDDGYTENYNYYDEYVQTSSNNVNKTETTTEAEDPNKIKSGHYKVGVDVSAGTYMVFANEKYPAYICVSSDSNGRDIIFNENFEYNCIIVIQDGQYLEISRGYALPYSDDISLKTDGVGFFEVGVHIKAGEYKLTSTTNYPGYYAVYDTPLSGNEDIIANDNFENNSYVTVKEGEYLLLNRCSAEYIGGAEAETTTKKPSSNSSSSLKETTTQKPSSGKNTTTTTTTAKASFPSGVKTYSGYSYAPDFGAMIGISYDEKYDSPQYSQTSYAYSVSKVMAVDPDSKSGSKYTSLLYECGYEYEGVVTISGVNYQSFYHKESGTRVRYGLASEISSIIVIVAYI